jgi:hypothetical protein
VAWGDGEDCEAAEEGEEEEEGEDGGTVEQHVEWEVSGGGRARVQARRGRRVSGEAAVSREGRR